MSSSLPACLSHFLHGFLWNDRAREVESICMDAVDELIVQIPIGTAKQSIAPFYLVSLS